ncbi:Mov34/MPN/PAD-1 family protein [Sphingomonas sp. Leaf4]|uniref:Mov34/MPN/PAD-1 family protein n=1 Tax=Sphingomonas sp. Leaf4 TaxID=2876553 RepID=UPI003FA69627
MTPVFSSELLLALLHEGAASPVERCGILRGEGARIVRADATANVAPDPARHFEIDPAALLAAHRDARGGGAGIAGWYHTHPGGRPDPSPTDAAQAAADGMLWLIVGHRTARLWRAVADGAVHGRFDPVAFTVELPNRVEKKCLAVHMEDGERTVSFRPSRITSL